VATCRYIQGSDIDGHREFRKNVSRDIRRIDSGERIAITAHGRVVAEMVAPGARSAASTSRWDALIAAGVLHPPAERGDPFGDWPDLRLPKGTASGLNDADRSDT
jgi:antitoxin (DNA-binding transcriptional repressor) of toxin-antitoxin stability system